MNARYNNKYQNKTNIFLHFQKMKGYTELDVFIKSGQKQIASFSLFHFQELLAMCWLQRYFNTTSSENKIFY